MVDVCTSVGSMRKKGAVSFVRRYASISAALSAEIQEIILIQGWGETKAERWEKRVRAPFMVKRARKKDEIPNARCEDHQRQEVAGRLGIGLMTLPNLKVVMQEPTAVFDNYEDVERELEWEARKRRETNVDGTTTGGGSSCCSEPW